MQYEPIQLKGGAQTFDPRLDRVPFFDSRSRNYPAVPKLRGAARPQIRSNTHNFRKYPRWLDQGFEGACVSFGIGHDLLAYPQERLIDDATCRRLYHDMQRRDPWPGGAYPGANPHYEGTSMLAGLQVDKDIRSLEERLL